MVVGFKEQIASIETVDRIVEATQERKLSLEEQLGKRKRSQDPNLLITDKELDVVEPSTLGQKDHHTSGKDGWTHKSMRCKFKCDKYGRNGYVHQDCTLELELCHVVTLGPNAHV